MGESAHLSTDESEIDDDEAVLVVKELVWRSDRVTTFFAKLDSAHEDRKSEQAKRQTKPCICNGTPTSSSTILGFEQLKLSQDFQDTGLCLQVMSCLISILLSLYSYTIVLYSRATINFPMIVVEFTNLLRIIH